MSLVGNSAALLFKIDADSSSFKREMAGVDASIDSIGGKFGSFADIASMGAAAIAGLGVAVAATGRFLFDLASDAAEYGSAIFDAQAKTGLAAETLSTLKLAADASGSSFEAISGSVSKFAVLVGQANQGNEKAIATLEKYGVTSRDLKGALEQAIEAISKESNETIKAAAAKDLFKDKTGAVLPLVAQLDGDLQKATETAIKMGTVLGEDDVKAADDLGDAIGLVSSQVKTAAAKFALAYGPEITSALGDISTKLAENKDEWTKWGRNVGDMLAGVKNLIYETATFAKNNPILVTAVMDFLTAGSFSIGGVVGKELQNSGRGGSLLREAPDPAARERNANDPRNPFYVRPQGKESAQFGVGTQFEDEEADQRAAEKAANERAKAREELRKRELAALKDKFREAIKIEEEYFKDDQRQFEQQFQRKEITAEQWREVSERNWEIYAAKVKQHILDAFKLEAKGKIPSEVANLRTNKDQANKAVDDSIVREREDREKTITGIVKKENDERTKSTQDQNAKALADARAFTESQLSDLRVKLAQKLISERSYNEQSGQLKLKLLELEKALSDDASEKFRIDQQIKILRNELQIQGIELTEREIEAANELAEAIRKQNLEWINMFAIVDVEVNPFQSIIDGWQQITEALKTEMPAMAETIDMMSQAFAGLANGIGSVITQWVQFGSTGPAVMRKILASALATIAAEAAVRAVYALAMGFFFLATGNYVDATNAFISAAIFGSIAAGAAIAGRAVAGQSFQQQSSASGGSSGGASANQSSNDPLRYTTQFNGYGSENRLVATLDRINTTLGLVEETQNQFNEKITTMRPDEVVSIGAKDASRDIRDAVFNELGSDVGTTDGFMRGMGLAR